MNSTGPVAAPQAGEALSHFAYSLHCSRIALERQEVARVFVQFRQAGVTRCGRVIGCEDFDGREFFKLETLRGAEWAPAGRTRLCSGDGRCTCEGGT